MFPPMPVAAWVITWQVRIHIDYRDTQGFYKNTNVSANPGTHIVDDFENYNINGRLLWEPNEDLDVDFRAHYGEVDAASITFNASFGLDVFGFILRARHFLKCQSSSVCVPVQYRSRK